MVSELSEGHATDWDVYLPARVFALCFQERPGGGGSGQRPFSLLCCSGLQPVRQPRGLQVGPAPSSIHQVGRPPWLTWSLSSGNRLRDPGEPPSGQTQSPQLTVWVVDHFCGSIISQLPITSRVRMAIRIQDPWITKDHLSKKKQSSKSYNFNWNKPNCPLWNFNY